MQNLKILIAGLGSIGRRHARLISEKAEAALFLCDNNEKNLKEAESEKSIVVQRSFINYDDALRTVSPDFTFICTPNHLHVAMALKAIDVGSSLMVEKPISDTINDARILLDKAQETGIALHVGYMMRYDKGLLRLKEIVESGAIGKPVSGRAMVGSYITLLNARDPDRVKKPHSLVIDYTHEIDYVRWFFGNIQQVIAVSSSMGDVKLKPPQNIYQLLLKAKNGCLIQIHLDYIQYPQRRTFEIYGDGGSLVFDLQTGIIQLFAREKEYRFQMICTGDLTERLDVMYRAQLDDILRHCIDKQKNLSGENAMHALVVATAAIESSAAGGIPIAVD